MALTPQELEQFIKIREGVARIDERTERMDEENKEKFEILHERVDRVRDDARNVGIKGGATAGGVIGIVITSILNYFGAK